MEVTEKRKRSVDGTALVAVLAHEVPKAVVAPKKGGVSSPALGVWAEPGEGRRRNRGRRRRWQGQRATVAAT